MINNKSFAFLHKTLSCMGLEPCYMVGDKKATYSKAVAQLNQNTVTLVLHGIFKYRLSKPSNRLTITSYDGKCSLSLKNFIDVAYATFKCTLNYNLKRNQIKFLKQRGFFNTWRNATTRQMETHKDTFKRCFGRHYVLVCLHGMDRKSRSSHVSITTSTHKANAIFKETFNFEQMIDSYVSNGINAGLLCNE